MLDFNGVKFAKNERQFVDSLFQMGGTCHGFYKVTTRGVQLSDHNNDIFAFIVDNGPSDQFLVSCSRLENGKIIYMQSTTNKDCRLLSLDKIGHHGMINECKRILKEF